MVTKICWVIPKFNNDEDIVNLLPAIENKIKTCSADVEIIVHCNDGSKLANDNPSIKQIISDNVGYLGAFQNTYEKFKNKFDFWILSNADIQINELNFDLTKDLSRDIVVSPHITAFNGAISNEHMDRRPTYLRMKILKLLVDNIITSQLYHITSLLKYKVRRSFYPVRKVNDHKIRAIYAPAGSFVVVGTNAMSKIFKLRFKPILFGEEQFIAEMCIKNSVKVIKDDRFKIAHKGFATTGLLKNKATLLNKKIAVNFNFNTFYK